MPDQVDLSERSIQNLTSGIVAGLNGGRNFGSGTGSSTSTTSVPSGGIEPNAAAKGFYNALVGGAEKVVGATGETVNSWRRASDIGLGFSNDAIGLRSSVGQTRLSVEEWESSIKRGSVGFTNLGGTVSESAKVFNKMSRDFSDTTAADQLREMGYTTKEYNDVLAVSLAGRRNIDMNDAKSRKDAIDSTANLAQELDLVAKLTGKSRQETLNALAEKQKDARLQASLELAIRKGDSDARAKYNQMDAELQKVGLDKLGAALYSDRGLTAEESAQMSILQGAGVKLQEAVSATKSARTPEEKALADERMKAALAEVAARTKSEEYLQATASTTGKIGEAFQDTYIKSRAYSDGVAKIAEDMKKNGSTLTGDALTKEAAKQYEQRARYEQQGRDAQGNLIAGANTTALVVQAQNRLKDSTVGLYQTLDAINQRFGRSGEAKAGLTALGNVKEGPAGPEAAAGRISRTYGVDTLNASIESGTAMKTLPSVIGTAVKEGLRDGLTAIKTIGTETLTVGGQGVKDFLTGLKEAAPTTGAPVVSREFGSMGSVGKMIEDFGKGTPAMLHGKEGIVTEDQFKGIFGGLQNNMKGELDKVKTGIPDVKSLQQMFSQIKMPDASEIANNVSSKMPMPVSASGTGDSDAIIEVAKGVSELNMRIERLITAVTDGSAKNIRAIKSGSNLLG